MAIETTILDQMYLEYSQMTNAETNAEILWRKRYERLTEVIRSIGRDIRDGESDLDWVTIAHLGSVIEDIEIEKRG